MWKQFVKDYLSFTKSDRVGMLVLLLLIIITVLLPYCWPSRKFRAPVIAEIQTLQSQARQLAAKDSSAGIAAGNEMRQRADHYNRSSYAAATHSLFYFDPNTLDAAGWQSLGIREKTSTTLLKYLARGGHFNKPEDLQKVYGLFRDDYERLLPYVRIVNQQLQESHHTTWRPDQGTSVSHAAPYSKREITFIDINSADTSAFIALPGIGSKLAARIINFREKLGGFYSVAQVAEIYGLADSVFGAIKDRLQCAAAPSLRQVNINTADASTLRQHPYIRWNIANAIVQYRSQHGNFTSPDDLLKLAVVTPEILKKLRPYIAL